MNELFYKYFKGETTRQEEKKLMDYVNSSETVRRHFLREHKLWDAYILHGDMSSSPTKQSHFSWKSLLRIAAIFLCVFSVGISAWLLTWNDSDAMQNVHVPPGSRVMLDLPDGSKVWLNANTEFSYPLNFGKKQRMVKLSGEGYFEVEKNKKPFIVHTDKYQVEVMGTTFNINAYKKSDTYTTSLVEGAVKIYIDGHDDILLQANEFLSYENNNIIRGVTKDNNSFLWRDGIIYFDDKPFTEMVQVLEQYYNLDIDVQTENVVHYRCTGKFRQSEGIEHILRVLQKDLNFTFYRSDDNQVVIIK